MRFEDLPQAKKGQIGEKIVDGYLRAKGYIPYACSVDGPHPFDRLVASRDKKTIFIAEVKTKPSRVYYPDTGINKSHYMDYKHIQDKYKIDVFLFFVDEKRCEIYGNFLSDLRKGRVVKKEGGSNASAIYPITQASSRGVEIIYFPLIAMRSICKLDGEQVTELCQHTTRDDKYESEYCKGSKP